MKSVSHRFLVTGNQLDENCFPLILPFVNRPIWLFSVCMLFIGGEAIGQVPYVIDTQDLSEEESSLLGRDSTSFVLKKLVAEAKRRNVEPNVTRYLDASFWAWRSEVLRTSRVIESLKESGGSPTIVAALEAERPSLYSERYFAKVGDDGVPFGQFIVEGRVLQVIDKDNLLAIVNSISNGSTSSTIWLSDVNTAGLADDADLSLTFFATSLWEASGTKSYVNAQGVKKTVNCLKKYPLDMNLVTANIDLFKFGDHMASVLQAAELARKEASRAEAKKVADAERLSRVRTWTDVSGKFNVTAEYRGMISGKVRLRLQDGSERMVPLDQLSDNDRADIDDRKKSSASRHKAQTSTRINDSE
jgi:hypothetical protein